MNWGEIVAMASVSHKRKIVYALCKVLSLNSEVFLSGVDDDLKSLCTKILKSSKDGISLLGSDELMKWVEFTGNLPVDSELCSNALSELNDDLIKKSVLLGNGLKPSAADVIVFAAVHSLVIGFSKSDKEKFPHLLRWMEYIQDKVDFGESFQRILLEKYSFEPPVFKNVKKAELESSVKRIGHEAKETISAKPDLKSSKHDDKKTAEVNQAPVEKKKTKKEGEAKENKKSDKGDPNDNKKKPEKEADAKDKEVSVTLLKIQVGLVLKASKHPSADSLLVEEINVGESKPRQVVSGLAKYISPEQMTNRYVLLITNLKPAKLRDVVSEGMVLCASNQDHTAVEPVIVPEGAKVGECITFLGHEGKPEDVLNPKKKQLEKITPHLFTDASGLATFEGVPFMTSAGPCKSSIPNASIK